MPTKPTATHKLTIESPEDVRWAWTMEWREDAGVVSCHSFPRPDGCTVTYTGTAEAMERIAALVRDEPAFEVKVTAIFRKDFGR